MSNKVKEEEFLGILGSNVPLGEAEQEENVVKYIYSHWLKGKIVSEKEICQEFQIGKWEGNALIKRLVCHGYIEEYNEKELTLTSFGKVQGAECVERHKGLTHFIQTICAVDEEEARENACRMEHVISEKVVEGFRNFIRDGDVYDREMSNINLYSKYKKGTYTFCMGIYKAEQRYPRVFAKEYYEYLSEIQLVVAKDNSYFYLKKDKLKQKEEKEIGIKKNVWYKHGDQWKIASVTKMGVQIPTEAFIFLLHLNSKIIEADGVIAFSASDNTEPRSDYRELNIHLW